MNNAAGSQLPLYSFDDLQVDCAAGQVRKGGQSRKITPRAFLVLVYLLEERGRIVDKQEFFDNVWNSTFVSDNALTRTIAEIRRVIGDRADQPRYIETVPKRGYRFAAEVEVSPAWPSPSAAPERDVASDRGCQAAAGLADAPDASEGFPARLTGGGRSAPRPERRRLLMLAALGLAAASVVAWLALLRPPGTRLLMPTMRTVPFLEAANADHNHDMVFFEPRLSRPKEAFAAVIRLSTFRTARSIRVFSELVVRSTPWRFAPTVG